MNSKGRKRKLQNCENIFIYIYQVSAMYKHIFRVSGGNYMSNYFRTFSCNRGSLTIFLLFKGRK